MTCSEIHSKSVLDNKPRLLEDTHVLIHSLAMKAVQYTPPSSFGGLGAASPAALFFCFSDTCVSGVPTIGAADADPGREAGPGHTAIAA
jgi:hypothetical protein